MNRRREFVCRNWFAKPVRVIRPAFCAVSIALGSGMAVTQAVADPIPEFVDPGPGTLVHVDAQSLSYDQNGTTVIARGDVVITYGDYTLTADTVRYNPQTEKIVAIGNVVLKEPDGAVLTAHRMELGEKFREGFIDRVAVVMVNNARIRARTAARLPGGNTEFRDVSYTACEPCKEDPSRPVTWEIKADRITHNRVERTIEYDNAEFDFLGVPVAYVPSFSHADHTVKRKSGFLFPSLSFSDEFGGGVEVPYFWNLAPNYDLTFSPLITTKQGPVMKFKWRHRLANGKYSVTPIGVYELSPDGDTPGGSRWRGSLSSKGDFRLARNWTWGWDGTIASDDTFRRRYNIDGSTDITSEIYLTGLRDRNYFDMRAYHFKGLLSTDRDGETPYVLPLIDHSYYFNQPVLGGEMKLETSAFNLIRDDGTDSARIVTALNWEKRMVSDIGTVVTPFANIRGDIYAVDGVVDTGVPGGRRGDETVGRFLPTAGVDLRWPFVAMTASGHHVIEPIAQVIVRPNETDLRQIPNEDAQSFEFDDTNLFAYNKFSGLDRWEGGSRANVGLNYSYRMNTGSFVKASFGQSYHIDGRNGFADRSGLEDDVSDFVGALYFQVNENLLLTSRVRLDADSLDINRHEFGLNTKHGPVSFSANYADLDRAPELGRTLHQEELWLQGSVQVSQAWSVYGGLRYDIERDARISDFVGVGYDNECFGVRIHYRETFVDDRDIDRERAVSLRFELKTIGGAGFTSGVN